jgi:hypothetical protein
MKKLLFSSCLALAASAFQVDIASAQGTAPCGCGSNGSVDVSANMSSPTTAYRRFSYEPTPMSYPQPMSMNSVQGMPMIGTVIESQPIVGRSAPPSQSYRRYSYQPAQSARSNTSGARMERWQYSKTDPRKYR